MAGSLDLEIAATCRRLADLFEQRALGPEKASSPAADPIEAKLSELRAACVLRGLAVIADGYIREDLAAVLLGRSVSTLRNWRYGHRPIPYRNGGRVEYHLRDVAAYLVESGGMDE